MTTHDLQAAIKAEYNNEITTTITHNNPNLTIHTWSTGVYGFGIITDPLPNGHRKTINIWFAPNYALIDLSKEHNEPPHHRHEITYDNPNFHKTIIQIINNYLQT